MTESAPNGGCSNAPHPQVDELRARAKRLVARRPGAAAKTWPQGDCDCCECLHCEWSHVLFEALIAAHRCIRCGRELTDENQEKQLMGADCIEADRRETAEILAGFTQGADDQ